MGDKFRPAQGGKNDQALIRFDLRADMDSCWNWNTKLLFVYLTAQYETPANALNQVVLWDSMLHSQETAQIELSAERNKYFLTDQGVGLRSARVNLTFHWCTMPVVGLIFSSERGKESVDFPESYYDRSSY